MIKVRLALRLGSQTGRLRLHLAAFRGLCAVLPCFRVLDLVSHHSVSVRTARDLNNQVRKTAVQGGLRGGLSFSSVSSLGMQATCMTRTATIYKATFPRFCTHTHTSGQAAFQHSVVRRR